MPKKPRSSRSLVGWREWILLPELSAEPIKAKIDTGALTSSLHAFGLEIVEREGSDYAEFEIHPRQRSKSRPTPVVLPISGFKRVRSSTGHSQRRPVVRTQIRIGDLSYAVDITLTSRDAMGFRMLLGRSALRGRFLVDPGRSYVHASPSRPNTTHTSETT